MAVNKDTHVSASVILPIETYKEVQKAAKINGRSASSQMARYIIEGLESEMNGLETKRNSTD